MSVNITMKTSTKGTTSSRNRKIEFIVVHYTAGFSSKPGSAINTANWFMNPDCEPSADFIVDDTTIVQYNPDVRNRYCWHCGGDKYNTKGGRLYGVVTNKNSIGIEVCSTNDIRQYTNANDSHWSFTKEVVNTLESLVKHLMEEFNIDADHVVRHYDVTGKLCPGIKGWNADSGDESKWNEFKSRLGKTKPVTPSTTKPSNKVFGRLTVTYSGKDGVEVHNTPDLNESSCNKKFGPVGKATKNGTVFTVVDKVTGTDGNELYKLKSGLYITASDKYVKFEPFSTYTVKRGDSLWSIAQQILGNGERYPEIKSLNNLKDNVIYSGTVLYIPIK